MYGTLTTVALLGLSAFASARPMIASASASAASSSVPAKSSSAPSSLSTGGANSTSFNGTAFKYPIANGFPNVKVPSTQLNIIQQEAQGTLPNAGPPPTTPNADSLTSLGLVAFNELFEVAFFTELVQNITNYVPGYDQIENREQVLRALKVALAQEELHELNANTAFNAFTKQTVEPCQYDFPVASFTEAIQLASTFTDVVLSVLPDIQTLFAEHGDSDLIRGVGSVIGQEGEQNGFYRSILGKVPSALPFLTGGARDFAFSGILGFVKPQSCPSFSLLQQRGLNQFPATLTAVTQNLGLEDTEITFAVAPATAAGTSPDAQFHEEKSYWEEKFVTYINQQNLPVSVKIDTVIINLDDGSVQITASFPAKTNGLTIAAITTTDSGFTSPDDVAMQAVAGSGLIEIN